MSSRATLRPVSATERTITMALVGAAIAAWLVVAFVLAFVSPENDAVAQLVGALVLGTAVSLTVWPLLWSATRQHQGALLTSARRSALIGLVVSILVVLRAIDVVSPVVLVFLVVAAVVVEVAFTLRR
jgi:hypothetical protein